MSSSEPTEVDDIIHPNPGESPENKAESQDPGTVEDEKPTKEQLMIKFWVLVRMLRVLHQRIKTKHASRFLSTSLQATLSAYAQVAHFPLATEALFAFLEDIMRSHNPAPPPQNGQAILSGVNNDSQMAPDPEDELVGQSEEEVKLQVQLICSLVTHVLEKYVDSFTLIEDIPALAWTARSQEKRHPENIVPHRKTVQEIFDESAELQNRDMMVQKLLTLVTPSLHSQREDILRWMIDSETDPQAV